MRDRLLMCSLVNAVYSSILFFNQNKAHWNGGVDSLFIMQSMLYKNDNFNKGQDSFATPTRMKHAGFSLTQHLNKIVSLLKAIRLFM